MSTPTEQFANLSLPSSSLMEFDSTPIDERKIQVRDILSSFHRDTFPTEFRTDIFARINDEQGRRENYEWTIPEDLEGTLMQWGVHDEHCWSFLGKCQTPRNRATLFNEKLRRRFERAFESYEGIANLDQPGPPAPTTTSAQIRTQVRHISDTIRTLVQAAQTDQAERQIIDDRIARQYMSALARQLLSVLETVCKNHEDVSPLSPFRRRHRRPTSGAEPECSLYHDLIGRPPRSTGVFMLDALDQIPAAIFEDMTDRMQQIGALLLANRAPRNYRERFRAISDRALSISTPGST